MNYITIQTKQAKDKLISEHGISHYLQYKHRMRVKQQYNLDGTIKSPQEQYKILKQLQII